MLSRKINAVISLLTTVLLLNHAVGTALWMLSRGAIAGKNSFLPWVMAGLMVMHAFISIELGISAHVDIEKKKCKSYPKLNAPTIIQRMSGILLIVFTGLHIGGTVGYLQPPKVVHAVLPILFFTVALAHAAISTSKAFITLGIGNARFIRVIDVIMKVLCGITLIADITGFYLYLV